ncbi:nipped-B-like protein isoform X1 [Hirundo rustica]|uniref:nipped-B-like protein isoform X1 n=1 Tax=Hirundo rustica TaxID=43150 RepID=UPI001A9405DC|nr:nipped-B-like protein isoform X1 [Hirundo rustica]XP_058279965.1 nipped-B-like protein isoform X1 [Hirundo rustica]
MNGDMPHVPITTLAGIASLTDLLNQLPLPSPLPATTTKSLLFNGRIAEEVNCLLACRDENLVSQLVHSLNQVSTDHIELKDNLGSDDPEGDIPVLLQAILARNPNVFREKSMQNRYGVQSGMMMSQFNISQNSMRGSPASSNYQQTTISHSPSSRFVPPQTSSGNRFLAQQNSPVPSPYAPQSPAGYMPYSHPPSYTAHPQMQQASVSSPIVTAGMRNLHENKVSSQLSGNSANHHADSSRHGTNEDYLQMVHRLSSDDGDPSIRNAASFPLRSPQSVCSPAGSDGALKGSRQPLIQQSQPPPYSSPRDVPPDILLDSPERKQKKQKKMKLGKDEKDQTEKAAMYDIISSPSKDSTKLTLRLSRVRSSDMDQQDDMLSGLENSSVSEGDIPFNVQYPGQTSKTPVTPQDVNRPINTAQCLPQHEQTAFLQAQQVPVLQQNTSVAAKQPQTPVVQTQQQVSQQGAITSYDEVELDALAEIERIERESAIERERFSKEVQDKDKPLKKRKQENKPPEAGGATGGNRATSQETGSAGNGARPALMVSIDLQHAGRADSQATITQDLDTIKKPEEIKPYNDGFVCVPQEDTVGVLKFKPENHPEFFRKKSEFESQKTDIQQNENRQMEFQQNESRRLESKYNESKQLEVKPESRQMEMKQNENRQTELKQNESRQMEMKQNEGKQNNGKQEIRQRPETPKQKTEGRPETPKQKSEGRPETPKHKHDNRRDSSKPLSDKKIEISRHKLDVKSDPSRMKPESRPDPTKPRPDGRSVSDTTRRDHDSLKQRSEDRGESERYRGDPSKIRRPEYLRSSNKNEHDSKHGIKSDGSKPEKFERKYRHESGDSRFSSGDQKSRPDSPRIKQEGKGDSSKSRPDKPGFKSPNSKDERRTDGNKSKVDSNKAHGDSKAEFPSYLLGGRSGALKHFVIPKLKRDKDGNVTQESRRTEFRGEHKDKVEKIGLVEDLNKGAKPVVVLQKLSLDDVQKFIKDREDKSRGSCFKPNKNKSSKPNKGSIDQSVLKELPPELLAEIESTMPLCERVKMNKRKRSTVNEKPKYAEISSDEDNDSEEAFESSRKRHKKDRDEAWEYEEHDRRSSGDHRRSSQYHEGRRISGSGRYRNRSPDDSDMDDYSSPPSLSEVARKMKKKEKQKKRKAYEPKLTPEEMMDSSTFKRFTASIENILENLEDMDFTAFGDDDEIPQELLLGKHQLSELGSESAKIKAMGIMDKLSTDKTVKVLNILEKNIQDGSKLSTLLNHNNDTEDEERLWRDLIMERVTKSADACLTAINIMTSPNMPKAVYIEDVIERVIQYTKFHLQNTLYPQYDPVYRVDPHGGGVLSSKAKRAKCSTHKQRVIVMLYNKVCDIVSSLSELLEIQLLTDTTILQVSSMGITPFFVENVSELQLCAIKLVTAVFSRYEKHRQLILEEIFTSLARLPTSKRSLRNFRLNSSDTDGEPMYIQMVTALVLQLIQCVVHLPSAEKDSNSEEESNKKVDQDVLITNSYETAMRTAQNFLSIFLKKCGSKQGEEDYRPLFENFIQDLLSTVNKPEWPAAELLLSLLGRLLVHQFSNKSTEMALRVASLDYLGTVAARLRKDAVTSKMDQGSLARILKQVSGGDDEIQQLQKALLDYLDENTEIDASLVFSRKFYVAQWFRDTTMETEKAIKSQKDEDSSEGAHHAKDVETTGQIMHRAESRKKFLRSIIKTAPSQFSTLKMNSDTVDYEDACLIVRYLASMRPFAQSFDIYLTQILRVLGENAIAVRTKAMKCLSEVVAVDPSILARLDMQRGVHGRLMDNSTSVREAAVELLGRFVLCRPQLAEQYYDMLIERILDTGISVRKRVIKILRDICIEQPTFPKITEMCVKMIRRVNDEEGIKKLVNETFQKLWFTPTPHHDKEAMTRKILNITDVVAACRDTGYDWFEQLLQNLLKSEEDASYKPVKKACTQLVDNLVEHILKYEESLSDSDNKGVNSGRLVACITTLFLFSKIRPQLMVKHAMTMQPYLTTKCSTQNDFMVICNVAKILELVVPLMEHPSETFLATIEEDLMKLIIKYGMTVVQHCVSCLGAVVNKVTQNYKFVWACFNRYYGALSKLKNQHQEDPNSTILTANKPALLRSLFTVGALCRHFDFDQEDFKGNSKVNIKDKVLELLMYFTKHSDEEVQTKAIIGLGFAFIQHPSLMFEQEVKTLYNSILSDKNCSVNLKIQVLKNLQTYLQEEDTRMQQADRDWKKVAKQEDLKEMGDISSGMSSSIMQLYLKQVLEAFFHNQSSVRHFALNVIALTLNQGLIHPVQCVPYLIAMGTDPEPSMRNKADQQLVEIDKKYAGFIHMKAVAGMKMSYQVQQAINTCPKDPVRGFRHDESSSALCSHLYSMIRGNRQHRRAFLISLLNLFDDTAKTEVNMLLYIADNLACFPYQTQEEPLFIMHHIDITLSVSGSNLLQSFKESMVKDKKKERKPSSDEETESDSNSGSGSESEEEASKPRRLRKRVDSDSDSDEENDINAVMKCLPENSAPLIEFANVSQGILLLLMLKQHLKNLCGFSDSKIQKYSPSESAKVYDKAINRKTGVHFHPKQTLDFLRSDMANSKITEEVKRSIVKQYLDFKLLMEHLDPDEEEEDGEVSASTNARNKAITSLLGGGSPKNNAAETEDDESDGEDRGGGTSGSLRRSKRNSDSTELAAQMNESVDVMDVIAICCPKYKDRPQIARVVQKTSNGFSVQWMAGSYSGSWTEAKRRDGRKLVPWVDTIKESDIIYKKIALTSANKLTNKVVQTLRSLYAAKDGTSS